MRRWNTTPRSPRAGGPTHPRCSTACRSGRRTRTAHCVILAQGGCEEEVSPSQFRELRDMAYTLRFSPDDHLLAASTDGGKAWTLFRSRVAREPHGRAVLVPSPLRPLAGSVAHDGRPRGGDPRVGRSALSRRGSPSKPHLGGVAGSIPEPRGTYPWTEEVDGAFRHACFHKEDKDSSRRDRRLLPEGSRVHQVGCGAVCGGNRQDGSCNQSAPGRDGVDREP